MPKRRRIQPGMPRPGLARRAMARFLTIGTAARVAYRGGGRCVGAWVQLAVGGGTGESPPDPTVFTRL